MATLLFKAGLTPERSELVIKETGEMIKRVQRVEIVYDVDTKEHKAIITLLAIDIEIPEELVEYNLKS
jgi:hypothetical protein